MGNSTKVDENVIDVLPFQPLKRTPLQRPEFLPFFDRYPRKYLGKGSNTEVAFVVILVANRCVDIFRLLFSTHLLDL